MKIAVLTVLALMSVPSIGATQKVIYGDDNRVLVENSTNENFVSWATATAAMIPTSKVRFPQDGDTYPDTVKVFGENLRESQKLCKGEKFSQELTVGSCSGFLVEANDEQYLVTAGHCMERSSDCDDNVWAFGYTADKVNAQTPYLQKENVYRCKEIVSQKLSRLSDNDYAVIKLDRVVTNVTPLKFRTEGKVDPSSELVVIGHPSGLPTIINDSGSVRKNENDFFFTANLDTFGGNSGSAVLDAKTGLVEGILVRGETDYEYVSVDEGQYCYKPLQCEEGECRGEDVTRMTNISVLTGRPAPVEPEEDNSYDEFDNYYEDYDYNFGGYGIPGSYGIGSGIPWIDPDHF